MNVGVLLLIIGAILMAAYGVLFSRCLKTAGPVAAGRYSRDVARPKVNLIGVALLAAALFIPVVMVAAIFAVVAVGWVTFGTFRQRQKMRQLEFDQAFVDSLFGTSFVVVASIGCLLASRVWFQLSAT